MQIRTSRMVRFSVVAVGLAIGLASTALAQGNSMLGTWKLNVAKSHYDPGPGPKSDDRVYEAWEGDGVKTTFTSVSADGTRVQTSYAAHYDGKDYKYTGSTSRDAIALKRIDANTTESTLKKGGKTVQTTRSVISNGGKTMTLTASAGTDRDGKTSKGSVQVFDKQ